MSKVQYFYRCHSFLTILDSWIIKIVIFSVLQKLRKIAILEITEDRYLSNTMNWWKSFKLSLKTKFILYVADNVCLIKTLKDNYNLHEYFRRLLTHFKISLSGLINETWINIQEDLIRKFNIKSLLQHIPKTETHCPNFWKRIVLFFKRQTNKKLRNNKKRQIINCVRVS